MPECSGCGTQVRWLENVNTGNKAPIDVQPNPAGNVEVDYKRGIYRILTKSELNRNLFDQDEQPRFMSHFATCSNAAHFRSCRKCHKTTCTCAA